MEFSYEMLWKVFTWLLVSFLVARLVSLIFSFSSSNSASGYVKDSSFKRCGVTSVEKFDGKSKSKSKSKRLKVIDDGKTKVVKKKVKFDDDQLVKVVEFDSFEEVFVKDVVMDCGEEVNVVVDDDLGGKFGINEGLIDENLGNEESGFEMGKVVFDDYGESGEFGVELVDQIVEKKEFVGKKECGNMESGVNVVDCSHKIVGCGGFEAKSRIVCGIKDGVMSIGSGEVLGFGSGLGGDRVVCDVLDHSKDENSSNVHNSGEKSGVVEFVGHSTEGIGVGLDGNLSDEVSSSNVQKEEESGMEISRGEGVLSDDDDEWEGVERSELEKKFASAVNFVGCQDTGGQLAKVDSDVMAQLYGLQKIAMEGECHDPQPMALKLSARAKWNAWQRLGNMNREEAMEQYVNLLSDNISGWMEDHSSKETGSRSSTLV